MDQDALRPAFADWNPNEWTKWGEKYRASVAPGAGEAMRAMSPKYVPREWMLIEAYTAANSGDYSKTQFFHDLSAHGKELRVMKSRWQPGI